MAGHPREAGDGPSRTTTWGEGFYNFLLAACRNLLAFTDGAVYFGMSSSELHTLQRALVDTGGHWSTFIIWTKNTFTLSRADYQRQYEPSLSGWREGARHHWCGDRDQGDVWVFDKPSTSPLHPNRPTSRDLPRGALSLRSLATGLSPHLHSKQVSLGGLPPSLSMGRTKSFYKQR